MKTKLILRVDHPVLGHTGDVIEVASGFARNHLVPLGLAYTFSEDAMRRIDKKKDEAEQLRIEMRADMESLAKRLADIQITFLENVSEAGHLYGAVTAKRIAEEIGVQGLEIPEAHVRLAEPLRTVGEYEVPIHVHSEISAAVKVWVVAKEEPKPEDSSDPADPADIPDTDLEAPAEA